MRQFNNKVFVWVFGVASSILFAIALTIVVSQNILGFVNVLLAVISSLSASVVLGAMIASYRYPGRWFALMYRRLIRRLALGAIEASMAHATTRTACMGILNRNGTVALKIQAGELHGVVHDLSFHVYEATDDQLWGRVSVVDLDELTSLCEPFDRINEEFWERLEDRMNHDTSPPNVYLIQELPTDLLELVKRLLNNWR